MSENLSPTAERRAPRVVVIGLASCFGCQINITNIERHLMDVLGQIDLGYWQLTSSVPMPDEFDVAVIEGAVTTEEAAEMVRRARERAGSVIAIGSCAVTGGIPGMASGDLAGHVESVYGDAAPEMCIRDSIEGAPKALRGALRYLSGGQDLGLFRVGVRGSLRTRDVEIALWTTPGPFPRAAAAKTLASALKNTSVVRVVADPGRARKVKTVSYTHLDVYKRQV